MKTIPADYRPAPDLLRDRVILVTGAGSGLGAEAAKTYAAHGATVILLGPIVRELEMVYDAIDGAGHPQPAIYPMDLEGAHYQHHAELAATIEREFGRLDGVLHNAALLGARMMIEQFDLKLWARILQINLNAPFLLTRACLPLLRRAPRATVVFSADEAVREAGAGKSVILVRIETSPEDIHGMHVAEGILTARGGMTSHAAVVARGMGKPCVAGCGALEIDYAAGCFRVGGRVVRRGDIVTLDGSTGEVFAGAMRTIPAELSGELGTLLRWADAARRLAVRANADTPQDARAARQFGAKGIGLCRTEHMFFAPERITAVRRMILADGPEERALALAAIEPMQRGDFAAIFRVMAPRPVTIRTLDPPLHEFLPHGAEELAELAQALGVPADDLRARVDELRESNPMLGHRGCRLGIAYPEITRMQARAILEAALEVQAEGVEVHPEIMVPLVGHVRELTLQKALVVEEAEALFARHGARVDYTVGTMIEVPRAALTAGEIAREAAFFSFGTNDLTQMTLGLSRDDAGKFLPDYVRRGIYAADPFVQLDSVGVGRLMRLAVAEGREARPGLKVGICGEHGGDPTTVIFCSQLDLDYVSCSPYRVPIARLAAAQASLLATEAAGS